MKKENTGTVIYENLSDAEAGRKKLAAATFDQYIKYIAAGFTEEQAWELIKIVIVKDNIICE